MVEKELPADSGDPKVEEARKEAFGILGEITKIVNSGDGHQDLTTITDKLKVLLGLMV
jgi:hypothetical protein